MPFGCFCARNVLFYSNMKKELYSLCGVAAVVFAAEVAFAAPVPMDGLLDAVAAAQDGDVLELSADTYVIDREFVLEKAVTLRGAGIDQTIIRQTGADQRVLALSNVNARVEGCTLKGGRLKTERGRLEQDHGGCGVLIYETGGTLSHCRITDNQSSINQNRGIGIDEHSSAALVEYCIIDHNIYTAGSNGSFAGIRTRGGTYNHCLIVNNKGHNGGGVYVDGVANFNWCTIAGNNAPDGCGAVVLKVSGATFENCIIAGNRTSETDASTTAPEYSVLNAAWANFNNCAFPRSISINATNVRGTPFQCDVRYVDPDNEDYRLRVVSGAKDIGFYAPYDYDTFACDFTLSTDSLFVGETVVLTPAMVGIADGEAVSCAWTVIQPDGTSVGLTGAPASFLPTQAGLHSVRLTASKDGSAPVEYVQEGCFLATNREASVSTTAELLEAIELSKDGSVITCAAGTYDLTDQITLKKGIRLMGAGWATTTLRQTAKKHRVVEMDHPNDWIEGFTITGGNSGDNKGSTEKLSGLGVYIGLGGGTIRNCHIVGNTNYNNWNHGIGVYSIGSSSRISHCVITNNLRTAGVNQYGGGVYLKDGTLDNCLVAFNTIYSFGGGVYAEGSAKIRNCTICGNAVVNDKGGGIFWKDQSAQAQCVNTVFADNKSSASDTTMGRPEWASNTSRATVQKTSFPSAVSTAGLSGSPLSIDPIFVDAAAGDFHMMASSTARDAGEDYSDMSAQDLDGNDRKSGTTAVDLGCYEYDALSFGAAFEGPSDPRGFKGVLASYTASATGVDESLVTFNWRITSPSGKVTTATGKIYGLEANEYGIWSVSMSATAGGVTSEPYNATYSVCPPDLYVVEPTDENIAKATPPFDSWGTAATDLLELMRVWALPGCTIHLGEGTIPVDRRVDLSDGISLVGQGWTRTTLLQTQKTTSILYLNNENARASGMTLTGFHAEAEVHSRGAVMIEANGGTVEDCRITGNRYNQKINQACGIGITLNGDKAVCRRCVIDRNQGSNGVNNDRGGGVQGIRGLLESCLVCFNTNKYAGGVSIGSGNYAASNFKVRNCTVYGNVGTDTDSGYGQYGVGGIGQFSGTATVENTIVFGNASLTQSWTTGGYPECRAVDSAKIEFVNCLLPSDVGWPAAATGCLNGDPLFADVAAENFALTLRSPCRNAGSNDAIVAGARDLDGNPRVYGRRVDMGCYELQQGLGLMLLFR